MRLARIWLFFALVLVVALAACSGGDAAGGGDADAGTGDDANSADASGDAARSFAVGGHVSGLAGTGLVLDNLGETLSLDVDGPFAFGKRVAKDGAYNVTIRTQPTNPSQTCAVSSGSGRVGNTDVTTVQVTCARTTFTVGGSVTGLVGAGLVLRNNGGDDLAVSASGAFTFATPVASGSTFDVTVATPPAGQSCKVSGGTGTVAAGNVSSVVVNCSGGLFTVGGSVGGLGGTLVLQNNGGDDLMVTANGTFAFATPLAPGSTYSVTVKTQPSSPSQTCVVASATASGSVAMANVTSVSIACTTNAFTVGGSVSGLSGTVVLQDNGGDDLVLSASGGFMFATPVPSGHAYAVTVKTPPASQACSVATGSGTVQNGNVTTVAVTCAATTHTIGGTISGLSGTVVLRNNGLDDLALTTNGTFTFATPLAVGSAYAVTVFTQPATQVCSVTPGTGRGMVAGVDVTTVAVTCSTTTYAIGGTITGLSGTVVLRDNGGDDLTRTTNGPFTFATRLPAAQPYNVTVATQPAGQTCAVASGMGTVAAADVTSVLVACRSPGGSVLVARVGDGTALLSSASAPVFLEERNVADGALLRTIALPTAIAGPNAPFTLAGSAISEGGLSLSGDGHYVALAGYAAVPATAAVAASTSATINRVVARVDAAGNVDTSTHLNAAFSGASLRAASTTDGSGFWLTGSANGVQYAALGAGASTQIAATPASSRHTHVFGGQLYTTSASGTTFGVLAIGNGTPTTAGQTATLLPGFPTTTGPQPYSFAVLDRSVGVAGADTIYVAQDATPGTNALNVQKWTFDGATWTLQATFVPAFAGASVGARGLAAFVVGANVRVVATTSETTSRLVTFVDDGTSTPPVTTIATASINTAYRGVAFAPQ